VFSETWPSHISNIGHAYFYCFDNCGFCGFINIIKGLNISTLDDLPEI